MSTFTAIPFALSAIAVIVAVLGALYLRKHPQALSTAEAALASLHTKVDALITKVEATHAAALAPVTVALVQAQPLAAPVAAPAPAAPAPAALPPTQSTDATAPNFVPAPAAAAPAPAPAAPGYDDYADVIDWNMGGGGSALNYRFHGPNGQKTITVPDGYVGFFTIAVSDTPESKGGNGYMTTLNGMHPRQQPSGAGDYTHKVFVGMPVDNPADPRNIDGTPGTYTYGITSEGGGVTVARHYP